ncbi:MAG: YbjN domain-containing protein [Acidimicrobiia bacterium]
MTALADRIAELLEARGAGFERQEDDDRIVHLIGPDDEDGDWVVTFLGIEDPHEAVVAYAFAPVDCPAEHRGALAELVTRANLGLGSGCWELDLDDGELRARVGLRLQGQTLSDPLLEGLVAELSDLVEAYGEAALSVMDGEDPAEALDEADG